MIDDLLRFVPPAQGNAYMGMLQRVPFYVRNLCVIGDSGGVLGYLLKKRPDTRAYGIVHDSAALPAARKMLDGVSKASGQFASIPLEDLDGVVLCNLEETAEETLDVLVRISKRLSPWCHVFALFGDPNFGCPDASSEIADLRARIEDTLSSLGYKTYHTWSLDESSIGGPEDGLARLLMAVSTQYEPIEHVRALVDNQAPDLAFEVAEHIPRGPSESEERRVQVYAARLHAMAAWLVKKPGGDFSHRLAVAQECFYYVTYALPEDPIAYQAMARCWQAAGDHDMARRVLRTIHHHKSSASMARDLENIPECGPMTARVNDVPNWDSARPLRVLFLMNPRPHYGIDVLFDGLCDCLGDEQVIDYPHKPWLHGEDTDQMRQYPCRFDRAGSPKSLEEVLALLDGGAFDLILYADVEGDLPQDEMHDIIQRAGGCPVALVDGLDSFADFRGRVSDYLGFSDFIAYFKREKHRAIEYGPHTYPLPFAYDRRRALKVVGEARPMPLFWAGHRQFGTRRIYLETLEARYGQDLNQSFSPDDYVRRIRESAIGLNCFGLGFDTVRYWELPANGCMLLSDRLPIEIPFDFVDGKHAVFFDDLPSLIEKLDYYQAHTDEVAEIAAAGHAHYMQHHTNEARARQLLGWVTALGV